VILFRKKPYRDANENEVFKVVNSERLALIEVVLGLRAWSTMASRSFSVSLSEVHNMGRTTHRLDVWQQCEEKGSGSLTIPIVF
jgi:hypothetical protein